LGGILAGLLVLLLIGTIYESAAEAADAKAYPPPGKMVDVGGYRLHIDCKGKGSPTVVIEIGWGDSSTTWGGVQSEVAKTTRICTYDRAGLGWSEASPQPRMAREYAKELHTLLANAQEAGPFVLAGHSMGGYTVLVYAHDYPAEVAGLILVDAQKLPPDGSASPPPTPRPGGVSLPALMARIGLVRLLAGSSGASSVTPVSVQTVLDEAVGMSEGGAQAKAVTTLGNLPLIVLTRGKDLTPDWTASQTGFLALSSNSQQLFAEKSGHSIQVEQPEAAVGAIVKMVTQIRK
jgi:pimeloyl-ACP methyl ester carboxylesterase